ncbi:MAG: hypothetical protein JEZ01_10850 [Labilibaculum sp.]|nr:hypothetical protein [Labilibaculum sp.]MBI9058254.1 hypothetical protein [Labilibaculum sp.]
MDSKLVIQLLKSKTCEIQNLLDHFADKPLELEGGIELLESRINGLSQDFEILKRNIEPAPTHQVKEINEPVVKNISETELKPTEIIKEESKEIEKIAPPKEEVLSLEEEEITEIENKEEFEMPIVNDQAQAEPIKIISEKLSAQKLSDIQSAIGINDRFLFTRELFENNSEAYHSAISFVNEATNFDSVMNWVKNDQNWDFEDPTVVQFLEITKRKF